MLSTLVLAVAAHAAPAVYVDLHLVRLDEERLAATSLPEGHDEGWRGVELSSRQLRRLEKRGEVLVREVLIAQPGDDSAVLRDVDAPYISTNRAGTTYSTVPHRIAVEAAPTSHEEVELDIELALPDFSELVQGVPAVRIFEAELGVTLQDTWQVRSFSTKGGSYLLFVGPEIDGVRLPHASDGLVGRHRG